MTKEEVLKENIAIHCPTQKETNQVVDILGMPQRFKGYWPTNRETYCVCPKECTFGRTNGAYRELGYNIITAKDFIAANTEPLIQVGTIFKWIYNYEVVAINGDNCDIKLLDDVNVHGITKGKIYYGYLSVGNLVEGIKTGEYTIISQPTAVQNPINKTTNMQTQTISRKGMKEIYEIACSSWRSKIQELVKKHSEIFSDNVVLPQAVVKEMYVASSSTQKAVLNKYFKEEMEFDSTMLTQGQMMTTTESVPMSNATKYLFRSYEGLIGLDIMGKYTTEWATDLRVKGKKIESGTEFTLTVK